MNNLTCPDCDGRLTVIRSGTRAMGSGYGPPAEHGIPTTAECVECGVLWDRDHGDQGPWRRHDDDERWTITEGPSEVASDRDARVFLYCVARDEDERTVRVEISGTVLAADPATLPSPIGEAVQTLGASELTKRLNQGGEPPQLLRINTAGCHIE